MPGKRSRGCWSVGYGRENNQAAKKKCKNSPYYLIIVLNGAQKSP